MRVWAADEVRIDERELEAPEPMEGVEGTVSSEGADEKRKSAEVGEDAAS
jgi:hypothetical protein